MTATTTMTTATATTAVQEITMAHWPFVALETRAVLCPRLASLPLDQSESEGWHLFAPPRKASLVLLREGDRFTEVIAYCTLQGAF